MSSKTFNFYCDESTHLKNDGHPFMIIAYVSSPYNQLKIHKEALRTIKRKHGLRGEFKWTKVSKSYHKFYEEVLEYFFSTDLNFRAIIVDKSQIDDSKEGFSYDDFYFKMYFQLLTHKMDMGYTYNVYLDIKDTNSHKKLKKLKEVLSYNSSIRNFQFIRSHESSFMQITDLIMGALNYKLRGKNDMIAKNNLIEKIESHLVSEITSPTSKNEEKFNKFFINLR